MLTLNKDGGRQARAILVCILATSRVVDRSRGVVARSSNSAPPADRRIADYSIITIYLRSALQTTEGRLLGQAVQGEEEQVGGEELGVCCLGSLKGATYQV